MLPPVFALRLALMDGDKTTTDRVSVFVDKLRSRYPDEICGSAVQPASAGDYRPFPAGLNPDLRLALIAQGKSMLYAHQADAYDAVKRGQHLVIATPTASGKSLCFNLAVLDGAISERSKALYLFPTKALAQDQVAEISEINRAGDLGLRAYTFDGDTPADARVAVRTKGDIVVTNPDMLHQAILPHHSKWAQFFGALRFVVIDELHSYRGVFGSHVANVLRRLQRILRFYGSDPVFITCSATIGNAKEHAECLLGKSVKLIDQSGAPRGARHVLLWNPPVVNRELGIRRSNTQEVSKLARLSLRARLKTIIFAQSRLRVEVLTKYLKDVFDNDPRKPERIRGYRGGYLPTQRRDTERQLRAGSLDAVVTTSALELGVDIGMLDVCLLNGYPGSIAATWQRLGRAGRRQKPALGVLVAGSQALDQYVMQHPDYFFAAAPERARIAPDQLLILFDHIRCAAFELPFDRDETFGDAPTEPFLSILAEQGVVHQSTQRWHWIDDSYPAAAVSLRHVAEGNFLVIDTTGGKREIIAEVDYASAALTLYEGAIYMIQSHPWQVEKLDWEGRKAHVRKTAADYYTDAIDYTKLKPLASFAQCAAHRGEVAHGEVHVVRRVTGYKKIRFYSHENIGYGQVNLPDQELQTTAMWWSLPGQLLDQAFTDRQDALDGFIGASRALHTVAIVFAMAEAHDVVVAVSDQQDAAPPTARAADPSNLPFAPTIYLYDNYPGGMGFSAGLYDDANRLLEDAYALIDACPCAAGCPACIGPAPSRDDRSRTPKRSALQILRLWLA